MNLKFIGLSAVRRLPQITLVDRVTNSRASLSQREHSRMRLVGQSGRPVISNTFLARPCAYSEL
jgi:hypothetical protein